MLNQINIYLGHQGEPRLEMDKYVSPICENIYDPEKGDPEHGIAPGTAFDDLPEDWVCPYCNTLASSMMSFGSVMGG